MRNNTSGHGVNKVEMYFLAGLATAPLFMDNLRLALERRLGQDGLFRLSTASSTELRSELLYPYGDWSRSVLAQLWEIRADMSLRDGRIGRSIGGGRALAAIRSAREKTGGSGGTTLLIGHSGGGIAAVHAAERLMEEGGSPSCFAVKIGSPRCRIPERLKSRVLTIHAEGRRRGESVGRSPDLVSRLGFYGGWTRSRGLPVWRSGKHAPATSLGVPIVGKHADYFRDRAPYVNAEGRSNLDLIVESILAWLNSWE